MDVCLKEGEQPTLNDRTAMPRLEAAIAEVQRIRSVTPLGIPHGTSEVFYYPTIYAQLKHTSSNFPRWKYLFVQDVKIGGYDVPSGAMIVPMQWAVHTDPAYWRDPLEFRPGRFLSDDGSFFKPESFLPFQNGKKSILIFSFFSSSHFIHFIYFSLFSRSFQRETRLRRRGAG